MPRQTYEPLPMPEPEPEPVTALQLLMGGTVANASGAVAEPPRMEPSRIYEDYFGPEREVDRQSRLWRSAYQYVPLTNQAAHLPSDIREVRVATPFSVPKRASFARWFRETVRVYGQPAEAGR